jgi:uncharacterized membrane protein (DUF106 family)
MKDFVDKFATLISGAFMLLAALAWNETIKAFVTKYISPGEGFASMLTYAVLVTIIAVFVTIYLNKIAKKVIAREERLKKQIEKLKEDSKDK